MDRSFTVKSFGQLVLVLVYPLLEGKLLETEEASLGFGFIFLRLRLTPCDTLDRGRVVLLWLRLLWLDQRFDF